MTIDHIQEFLAKDPFEALVVKLSNGDVQVVQSPYSVALMESRIFLVLPNNKCTFIPISQITKIDSLAAV